MFCNCGLRYNNEYIYVNGNYAYYKSKNKEKSIFSDNLLTILLKYEIVIFIK